jgi:hypothetical protein
MDLLRNLSHFDISCEELKEKIERHFSINLKKLEFFEQQIEDFRKCLVESKLHYIQSINKLMKEKKELQSAKESDWETYSKNIEKLENLCQNIDTLGSDIKKSFDEKFEKFKSSLNSYFTKDDLLKENDLNSKSTKSSHLDSVLKTLQLNFPQYPDQTFKNIDTKYTKFFTINAENRNNFINGNDLSILNNSFCVISIEFSYLYNDDMEMPSNFLNFFENYLVTSFEGPTKTIRIGGHLKSGEDFLKIILKDDFFLSYQIHSIRVYKYFFEEDIISHCVVNNSTKYSSLEYFRKVEKKFKLLDAIRRCFSKLKKNLLVV